MYHRDLIQWERYQGLSEPMFSWLLFPLLAHGATISGLYKMAVNLNFDISAFEMHRPVRSAVDLIDKANLSVKEMFEKSRYGKVKNFKYKSNYCSSTGVDSRAVGWNILQGTYDFPSELTPKQLKLIIEWARIMVVFQSALKHGSLASKLFHKFSRFPFIVTRNSNPNFKQVAQALEEAVSLNQAIWDALDSLALQRLTHTQDHFVADSMVNRISSNDADPALKNNSVVDDKEEKETAKTNLPEHLNIDLNVDVPDVSSSATVEYPVVSRAVPTRVERPVPCSIHLGLDENLDLDDSWINQLQ